MTTTFSYNTSVLAPHSFHPIAKLSFVLPSDVFHASTPTGTRCSVHAFYQLPSGLFVDPYELAERRESYGFKVWDRGDLERPVHAVENKDTQLFIDVNLRENERGARDGVEVEVEVEVPFHARYGVPLLKGERGGHYREIEFSWPGVFLACPRDVQLPIPFDPTPPSYLSFAEFREAGVDYGDFWFLTIPPSSDASTRLLHVRIPVGSQSDLAFVQFGTMLTVLLAFFWVAFAAIRNSSRLSGEQGWKEE